MVHVDVAGWLANWDKKTLGATVLFILRILPIADCGSQIYSLSYSAPTITDASTAFHSFFNLFSLQATRCCQQWAGESPWIFECGGGGSNRRQGGQPTSKYPTNRKKPDFDHFSFQLQLELSDSHVVIVARQPIHLVRRTDCRQTAEQEKKLSPCPATFTDPIPICACPARALLYSVSNVHRTGTVRGRHRSDPAHTLCPLSELHLVAFRLPQSRDRGYQPFILLITFFNGLIHEVGTRAKQSLWHRSWPLQTYREIPGSQQDLEIEDCRAHIAGGGYDPPRSTDVSLPLARPLPLIAGNPSQKQIASAKAAWTGFSPPVNSASSSRLRYSHRASARASWDCYRKCQSSLGRSM